MNNIVLVKWDDILVFFLVCRIVNKWFFQSNGWKAFFNLIDDGNEKFYRLKGEVSTKNNGGFIQSRVNININSDNYEGLRIKVKGNNNDYYVHLRVPRMMPWNYYYAKFYATEEWSVVELPLKSFKFSRNQNISLKSSKINSIGLVAYGRNFYAELDIGNIELY